MNNLFPVSRVLTRVHGLLLLEFLDLLLSHLPLQLSLLTLLLSLSLVLLDRCLLSCGLSLIQGTGGCLPRIFVVTGLVLLVWGLVAAISSLLSLFGMLSQNLPGSAYAARC